MHHNKGVFSADRFTALDLSIVFLVFLFTAENLKTTSWLQQIIHSSFIHVMTK